FADVTLIRPEAQATWRPALSKQRWDAADAEFAKAKPGKPGQWKFRRALPARWEMQRNALRFWVQPAPSGHVGIFPDQACHWDWLAEQTRHSAGPAKVLSLFGHTGLATLAATAAGQEVTHVDASRKAVALARENQELSGLADRPVRWVVEDALTFVQREARRGNRYHGLILDPPRFGRGPTGEIWKLKDSLPELLAACKAVLSPKPLFVLLNLYVTVVTRDRAKQKTESLQKSLQKMLHNSPLEITSGELAVLDGAARRISASVFARAQRRPANS
ncbi:MAG TPA: class I SAM-dependent methyltransferase, partial [Candidatus Acidoferrum sp.]|nr:class I SAM-dependent methyltransferase [Candidatus Acidoferrum sp.]